MSKEALKRAIAIVGSQSALAQAINRPGRPIKQAHIWYWLNRAGREVPPAEDVIPIERATNGMVTRHDLRPDLFLQDTAT